MLEDEQLDTELLLGHIQETRQLGHRHGGVQFQETVRKRDRDVRRTHPETISMVSVFLNDIETWDSVLPANGGELGLLLHLLSKHLQLLLERFFVVVGVNIVVVWNHR